MNDNFSFGRATPGLTILAYLSVSCAFHADAQQPVTPVAQWDFHEGRGAQTVERVSGINARIHGATWVKHETGFALRLDGIDDTIDGGDLPLADLRGPLTLETWIHPDRPAQGEPGLFGKWFGQYALTFYRGSCWFYIGNGGNKVHMPLPVGTWSHVVAVFDGTELRLHINGRKAVRGPSTFKTVPAGGHVTIGAIAPNAATVPTTTFAGMIGSARLYDRPLTWKEVANRYNVEATLYGQQQIDMDQFDTLGLQLFPYPERNEIVARIDCGKVTLPRDRLTVCLELLGDHETDATRPLSDDADIIEVPLNPPDNTTESLSCRAALLRDGTQVSVTESEVSWMESRKPIPSIEAYRAPPLPRRTRPPSYTCDINASGLITIKIDGETYHVSSRFSWPQGGFNTIGSVQPAPEKPEAQWSVSLSSDHEETVIGTGAYYQVTRRLVRTPTRIEVVDEITNTTNEVLGVILEHRLCGPKNAKTTLKDNPTVFVAGKARGVGIVARDDIFFLRAENGLVEGDPILADKHLGLPPKGSHFIRWAIYPTATTDYYDFINQVRGDEEINGYVPGAFAFTTSWNVPDRSLVTNQGLAFYSWASLTRVLHNPTISLEGWEFTDYPKLRDKIRTWIGETRAAYPNLETTFHVAHSLFATNQPEALFPDSLAIDAAGNTLCYGGNSVEYYDRYFSPELVRSGWRWWIFYPTMENSFGKRMLDAADFMIQDLGATSVWADGYISGYVREHFTYDHWDGVSVTIDPESKTVTAKKALVPHVAMPVLKAVARKYADAGGMLITNGNPGPFSFTRLPVISSCETGGGDQQPIAQLHLGRTVTPLGNPGAIKTFQDIYDDILRKLDHGALYFWYGEGDVVTEPTIVSDMYPITFESIHPGTVRGRERIVTKVSGVYGWPENRALHRIHFYDGRGRKRPRPFLTTVDEQGVRTELNLSEGESAVVEKLPVRLISQSPLNVQVLDFKPNHLTLTTSRSPTQVHQVAIAEAETILQMDTDGKLRVVDNADTSQ